MLSNRLISALGVIYIVLTLLALLLVARMAFAANQQMVTIYVSKHKCPPCEQARALLNSLHVRYVPIPTDGPAPIIVINGHRVEGYYPERIRQLLKR